MLCGGFGREGVQDVGRCEEGDEGGEPGGEEGADEGDGAEEDGEERDEGEGDEGPSLRGATGWAYAGEGGIDGCHLGFVFGVCDLVQDYT